MLPSEFVQSLVSSLVESPAQVVVEEKTDDLGVLVTLRVAKDDMKIVIGKNGQTISALRTVLRVFGSKSQQRVNLRVIED